MKNWKDKGKLKEEQTLAQQLCTEFAIHKKLESSVLGDIDEACVEDIEEALGQQAELPTHYTFQDGQVTVYNSEGKKDDAATYNVQRILNKK
jgi:hypothetical protein